MTTPRRRSLHLPLSSRNQRQVFRRRRQPPRWRQFGMGIVLITLAAVMLYGLVQLPEPKPRPQPATVAPTTAPAAAPSVPPAQP